MRLRKRESGMGVERVFIFNVCGREGDKKRERKRERDGWLR